MATGLDARVRLYQEGTATRLDPFWRAGDGSAVVQVVAAGLNEISEPAKPAINVGKLRFNGLQLPSLILGQRIQFLGHNFIHVAEVSFGEDAGHPVNMSLHTLLVRGATLRSQARAQSSSRNGLLSRSRSHQRRPVAYANHNLWLADVACPISCLVSQ